ncbi:MAG: multicopper oxidase domain-containing protein [Flavobacteriales bacterium]|nr:multicopper oxidase domain-containing protein [Flavobacteriales bacterium]
MKAKHTGLTSLIIALQLIFCVNMVHAQASNPVNIPDTLHGPVFDLDILDTTKQFFPTGSLTKTYAYNSDFLGPTLMLRKGEFYEFNVTNYIMTDTTTTHWHGMHISSANDGGPHTMIFPGETWSPEFTVLNEATTFWYHPHLHHKTQEHINFGAAGMIIVEDENSDTLRLPKTYGVDEFPIIIQDKTFGENNQLAMERVGDSITINGTLNSYLDVPAQMVRFRLLNASVSRTYNVGLEDSSTFQMIASDGGFLNTPIDLTRLMLAPGERAELVIDFSNYAVGDSINLYSFNTELPSGVQGGASGPYSVNYNLLDNLDFTLLQCNVQPATADPVTELSPVLNNIDCWDENIADVFRTKIFSGGMNQVFFINGDQFDLNLVNDTIKLDDIEVWSLLNSTSEAHPFHIHDIQFCILDINDNPPPPQLAGWKDVVLVEPFSEIRFITKFETFADTIIPFMYHCHILNHEDNGMMGQFIVKREIATSTSREPISNEVTISSFGNLIQVKGQGTVSIYNLAGQKMQRSILNAGDNIFTFESGIYLVSVLNSDGTTTEKVYLAE